MLPIGMLDLLDGFGQATWVLCCRNVTWTLGAELRVKGASSKSDVGFAFQRRTVEVQAKAAKVKLHLR
jgi:hypothetical protein